MATGSSLSEAGLQSLFQEDCTVLFEIFFFSFLFVILLHIKSVSGFIREGDLRVIRPFVYVREKDLRNFAEKVRSIFVLFRLIKKRSFNFLCFLDLFSERWQSTLFQIFFFFLRVRAESVTKALISCTTFYVTLVSRPIDGSHADT